MWASQVVVKNLPANEGDIRDMGSILDPGRFPGEEKSNPLQYSCLKNPMDRGAWQATAHGVTKSWTGLTQLSMHTHRINASSPLCLKILLWFEAEAPKLWSPDMKNQITGKYPYVGKDWRHKEMGAAESTELVMPSNHHMMASPAQWMWVWANSGRQWRRGCLACYSPYGITNSRTQLSDWTTTLLI